MEPKGFNVHYIQQYDGAGLKEQYVDDFFLFFEPIKRL